METTPHQHSLPDTHRLRTWIAKWIGASWIWHAKFLSGTETSATQTRRPGPRIPRALLKPAFPSLAQNAGATSVEFDIEIDSHGIREDRVWGVPHTGEGLFGAPRAEIRITNVGTCPRCGTQRTPVRWRSSRFDQPLAQTLPSAGYGSAGTRSRRTLQTT